MSINSASKKVNLADGANTACVDSKRRLQVSDPDLQVLVNIGYEQLRQLTKIALILSQISGITVDDNEIAPPPF